MHRQLSLVAAAGITLIGGVSLVGYYLGKIAEEPPEESPVGDVGEAAATPAPSPSPEAGASKSPDDAPPLPTAPPPQPSTLSAVRGAAAVTAELFAPPLAAAARATPVPTSPPFPPSLPTFGSPATFPSPVAPSDAPRDTPAPLPTVSLTRVPRHVASGEPFTVEWRVDGPAGAGASSLTLTTSFESSAVSTTHVQTFGPATVPQTLSATSRFGDGGGIVHLEARAEVDGQALRDTASILVTAS